MGTIESGSAGRARPERGATAALAAAPAEVEESRMDANPTSPGAGLVAAAPAAAERGRVALRTLGCKVNQYDGEALLERFRRAGYRVVPFDAEADVYIVNTCTVTGESDRKSRQLIRRAHRRNPGAVVVVAGCYAQVARGEVAGLPGVGVVLGNQGRERVVELAESARAGGRPASTVGNIFAERSFDDLAVEAFTGRTRAPLKIQEGCNEFCTYCVIPYARGGLRSRSLESIRREAERLLAAGFREVVLTGVHVGAWGRDLPGRPSLAEVIRALGRLPGLDRLRLSSIEPMDVDEELLAAMAESPNFCHHLHLPLQAGSDRILRAMRRRYTTADFARIVERARRLMPDVGLSTDVITGFPGEDEEAFREGYRFLEATGFERLHVFPYSARKGTPAAAFPDQVPEPVKRERVAALLELGGRLAAAARRSWIGREAPVLVEDEPAREGWMEGLTPGYLRVRLPGGPELANRIVRVRLEGEEGEALVGRPVGGELPARYA
ncbi:MAG: tRNA (N(6)-L-threonylcarbamoyladenosine(37)-C(2))-methylthiotransferase MtaB [Bacillota bacterium]|nr:tRNA (N(6)-L-threonylcarbamoyladenosine(37)-C(2))-methylthiotransferase MtaB [Bacillota bacterium]